MDWILGRLACGSAEDAITLCMASPKLRHIDRIMTLAEQPVSYDVVPSQTFVHHEPLPDEVWLPPDLWACRVATLRTFLQAGATVLVHCRLGKSRSPALCAAYLISCGMGVDEARVYVEAKRPAAQIHPETWRGVVQFAGEQQ